MTDTPVVLWGDVFTFVGEWMDRMAKAVQEALRAFNAWFRPVNDARRAYISRMHRMYRAKRKGRW